MDTTVSFPGLGIEEFTIDRVAFSLFGKDIYWYGVIIMLGIVAAFVHAAIRCKREGIKQDDILDVGLFTVIFGVIGARLYYVLTTLGTHEYKNFIDVIAVWEGGLAIYGGVIGGTTALVLTALYKKINPLKVADAVGPGVMLAQAMGRWGNFVNGEAFGYEVAEDSLLYPFRMGLVSGYTEFSEMHFYHPTFLYESLWNIVGFVVITLLYRKKKFNGQIALMYFAWYGFGRMFIEGLRTDSLYVCGLRISQVVGLVCFVVGTALIVTGMILVRKGKLNEWLKVVWATPALAEGENHAATTDEPSDESSDGPSCEASDNTEPPADPEEGEAPNNEINEASSDNSAAGDAQ